MKRKSILIIAIVLAVPVLLAVLLIRAAPRLAWALDREAFLESLNNPIIDADYPGWKDVRFDDISLRLPENWSLESGDTLRLYNEAGDCIAFGTHFAGDVLLEDHILAQGSTFTEEDSPFEAFIESELGTKVVITEPKTGTTPIGVWIAHTYNDFVKYMTFTFEDGTEKDYIIVGFEDYAFRFETGPGKVYLMVFDPEAEPAAYEEAVAMVCSQMQMTLKIYTYPK